MDDTICAIATPLGEGGIGIIRISGPLSLSILKSVFLPASKLWIENIENRKLSFGHVVNNFSGAMLDEAMCVYMKAPHSYTGEDVVEIQCHGSIVSLKNILDLVIENGARMAEPGEFTKRAFLNGRLDLSQAEAVIDLISAKTDKSFESAFEQLEGKYSKKIREIRKRLVDVLVNITVNIDYPDEDIEELTFSNLEKDLSDIKKQVDDILATADTGRIIREGLFTAIIGKPNVGKSSLMNALLKENRAIVTSIPGTTRDTIEEFISIRNIPVKLVDTAGIRNTQDTIEQIGIEKSKRSLEKADLILYLIDSSQSLSQEDFYIMSDIDQQKTIVIINKCDLKPSLDSEQIKAFLPECKIIEASILNDMGLSQIEEAIVQTVYGGKVIQKDSILLTNARHKALFSEASQSLGDALTMTHQRQPLEFLEIDVNNAYVKLGEIIGEETTDDIINEVFSRFCLGK